jgi:hypothetical protein
MMLLEKLRERSTDGDQAALVTEIPRFLTAADRA